MSFPYSRKYVFSSFTTYQIELGEPFFIPLNYQKPSPSTTYNGKKAKSPCPVHY